MWADRQTDRQTCRHAHYSIPLHYGGRGVIQQVVADKLFLANNSARTADIILYQDDKSVVNKKDGDSTKINAGIPC